ncbi:MAG: glycosyltransferase family 8 protein [Clostridia bacterium]|nr:glycosyltransferase family 8 protein [Clostridia bacterium]
MSNLEKRISVVYAGNEGIFDGVLISVLSLIKHNKNPFDIYILTMSLSELDERFTPINERQRSFLEELCQKENPLSRVMIIDTTNQYRATLLECPNGDSYTPYALIRLFLDELDVPSKVLYLDTDTVIAGDISELWDTDISDYELAGVLDHYGKIFMGIRCMRRYLNSGVLLLNLDKIRGSGLFKKCIARLARKKTFLPDQTAINLYVKKKLILKRKFNEQKHFRDDTVIQHFSMTIIWHPFFPFFYTKNIKPWHTDKVMGELTHKYDDILNDYISLKRRFSEEI